MHVLQYDESRVPKALLNTSDTLLSELAEEARTYLALLDKLKMATTEEREILEAKLYASISHFKTHSEVTLECLDELSEALPDEATIHA